MKANLKRLIASGVALALVAGLALAPSAPVHAAATAQTTHAFLCQPQDPSQAVGPRRVVNPNTTNAYVLNNAGCALFPASDITWALSQHFYYGPSTFVLQQTAITASTTSTTSTITLPAYGRILSVTMSETAGNAITGGVDIGDSGSATRFASAVTLGANATVDVADSALTRIYVPSGVPTADQILVACHSACNSGSINITILYTYF